jgi:hypothetical protein
MTKQHHPRGYTPPEHPTSEKKQLKRMYLILAIVVVFIGFAIACGLSFADMGQTLTTELGEVKATLDGFMNAMAEKDVETADTFLTNTASRKLSEQLEEMVNGADYGLFEDYEAMKNAGFKMNTVVGKVPASTATATYNLEYADGSSGRLSVICEKWYDEWKIASFQIEKFAGPFTSP